MLKTYFVKSRPLFTDGWNSFWHFIFGILSVHFVYIMPFFVIYQLIDINDKNLFVDLIEYIIGFIASLSVFYIYFKCK